MKKTAPTPAHPPVPKWKTVRGYRDIIYAKADEGIARIVINRPEVRDALLAHGAQPVPGTPDEFARRIAAGARKWSNVVRESGAKID